MLCAAFGGKKENIVPGIGGFHGKSDTYILVLCVFSLSLLSFSLYSNSHQQTLRANSTCLTRLSARWCERGRVFKTPVHSRDDGTREENCCPTPWFSQWIHHGRERSHFTFVRSQQISKSIAKPVRTGWLTAGDGHGTYSKLRDKLSLFDLSCSLPSCIYSL